MVSDVFLAAFRNRGRYDAGRADARPWLYGIATKVISRHVRAEGRRARTLAALPVPLPAVFSVEEISDRIAAAQLRPRLLRVLAGLSVADRELVLGYLPDSARRQRGWQAWHRRRRVHSARTREGAG